MRIVTTFVAGLLVAGTLAASVAPAAGQSQRAEPWFRACGIEMVRRDMDQLQATFICSCIIGGVMVSSQLNDQQKAMIIRSPSFRPSAATREVGQYVRRIYNGCRKRLAAATGRQSAAAPTRPTYTLSRAGWMHRNCMRRTTKRISQDKARPLCDCWLRGIRDSNTISDAAKKVLLSTSPQEPNANPSRRDAQAVNSVLQGCIDRMGLRRR